MFKLLIPIHRYHDVSFSPKKVETWKRGFIYYDGARERGGTGLLGKGRGGSVPTDTVTLFQTLFAVVKRRMMKNPT